MPGRVLGDTFSRPMGGLQRHRLGSAQPALIGVRVDIAGVTCQVTPAMHLDDELAEDNLPVHLRKDRLVPVGQRRIEGPTGPIRPESRLTRDLVQDGFRVPVEGQRQQGDIQEIRDPRLNDC